MSRKVILSTTLFLGFAPAPRYQLYSFVRAVNGPMQALQGCVIVVRPAEPSELHTYYAVTIIPSTAPTVFWAKESELTHLPQYDQYCKFARETDNG
jgi:hypothetical protein